MRLNPDWLSWPEIRRLAAAFAAAKTELRFVGGAVRDALLSRPVQDIDAATPRHPEAVMALLEKAGLQAVPTGLKHGTVTAVVDSRIIEITTLRKDIATYGRHADVAYTDDWKEDAARRDFTMNALYLTPDGELFDYFTGAEDAKAGHVRFIGDAAQRIAEDYLRILRFFRFYAWYGKPPADAAALAACAAQAAQVDVLSGERLQHELLKMLAAPDPSQALELMQQADVPSHALGFIVDPSPVMPRFIAIEKVAGMTIPAAVKLSVFLLSARLALTEALNILCARLKLSNRDARTLQAIVEHRQHIHPGIREPRQKAWIRRLGASDFIHIVCVNWAQQERVIEADHPYHAMLKLALSWTPPTFPITGNDLIAIGMQPGKEMGDMLKVLEEQWEAGGYAENKQQLLARVKL